MQVLEDRFPNNSVTGNPSPSEVEKLITVSMAASKLGLPNWKLSRAARQGVFPTYHLLNSRRLVKLSEVVAAVEASRQGGDA